MTQMNMINTGENNLRIFNFMIKIGGNHTYTYHKNLCYLRSIRLGE